MQRYLNKVLGRRDFEQDPDLQLFLSDSMLDNVKMPPVQLSSYTAGRQQKPTSPNSIMRSLTAALVPLLPKAAEAYRGINTPPALSNDIDGLDDYDEFAARESYVLAIEDHFGAVLERFSTLVKCKQEVHKAAQRTFLSIKEQFGHLSPEVLRKSEELYEMRSNAKYVAENQIKEEIWHFGDVMLEYRNSIPSLKQIMNERTLVLERLASCSKERRKKMEKLRKLTENTATSVGYAYDVSDAEVAVKRADEDVAKARDDFVKVKESLTREMVRFEKEKSRDVKSALEEYARIQLKFEKQQLQAAVALLTEWQDK